MAWASQLPPPAVGEVRKPLRARYPDATHHCWAYRIGPAYRFGDDGEPGGTAGAPILRAIEGQGVDRVMVVVVRFYGGVKLGTGGLARAYGGTAAECLRMLRGFKSNFAPAPFSRSSVRLVATSSATTTPSLMFW